MFSQGMDNEGISFAFLALGIIANHFSLNPDDQKEADDYSAGATSRLFNWHRDHDDGLWLDDGTVKDMESIRQLQQHQWIKYPWGDDDDPVDETKEPNVDRERVLAWCSNVE